MQPASRRPDVLGDGLSERDDVVLGALFDFFDARDVERAPFADVAGRFCRYDAGRRHGLGRGRFDEQPGFVPALVAPDSPHFRVRIAWNHS